MKPESNGQGSDTIPQHRLIVVDRVQTGVDKDGNPKTRELSPEEDSGAWKYVSFNNGDGGNGHHDIIQFPGRVKEFRGVKALKQTEWPVNSESTRRVDLDQLELNEQAAVFAVLLKRAGKTDADSQNG